MKKLLIVESPAKAKTIGKYLGGDFVVKSSVGHVRDLPKKGGLAIRIEPVKGAESAWTFAPTYEVPDEKKTVVADLRKAARAADEIYLAPDPDREGEAIAWHLNEVLAKELKDKPVRRVTYNEITRQAVLAAVANPREIDMKLVDAQQSRRILDRIVGFAVSPLLWKYLNYGRFLSAGRVQTAALRILVEREREIREFRPEAYWLLGAEVRKHADGAAGAPFRARLARLDGANPSVRSEALAAEVMDALKGASLVVSGVREQGKTRHPHPPFTTSTLQQAASSVCGFTPKATMSIAQKLYEQGLITYMRTDSVNVSAVARAAAADFIRAAWGEEFLPEKPNFYKSRAGAQEAHEAIRPTDVARRPDAAEAAGLDARAAKLYALIWRRFLASQMAAAKYVVTTAEMRPSQAGLRHDCVFTASSTAVAFDGWLRALPSAAAKKKDEDSDEVDALPPLAAGDALDVLQWLSDRKETKPPARYSEASLVKALEENGVGRPSTYAATIEVLVTREYASRESRQLTPTKRGEDVCDWLVREPDTFFSVGYTAEMEGELDKVEAGDVRGGEMLSKFYAALNDWIGRHREPPPPPEQFLPLLDLFGSVATWRPPRTVGKRTYDDREFVESVRQQVAERPDKLSTRQLQSLARLAFTYREQIPGCGRTLETLGHGELVKVAEGAPDEKLVAFCFDVLDREGMGEPGDFVASLRDQSGRGRALSPKQFAALVRTVVERSADQPDAAEIRSRLGVSAEAAVSARVDDPALSELLGAFRAVKTWQPAVTRGRRTYDDREFIDSLTRQFSQKKSLSDKQAAALRRRAWTYREQLPGFAENQTRWGVSGPSAGGARRGGAKGRSKRR